MLKQVLHVWMVFCIVAFLCIEDAYAYIDPGTGSMILQALLAGVVAILAFWRQVKNYLSSLFSGKSANSAMSDDLE